MIHTDKNDGFTLVELLVVIGVIAIIIGVLLPNLVGVRGRARDSKRKSEMHELKTALRLYYNDYQTYPAGSNTVTFKGCGAAADQDCDGATACTAVEFAAGGSGCDTVYMKRLPRMATNGTDYGYAYWESGATGDDFCITTELENPGDKDIAISQARCSVSCNTGAPVAQQCTGTEYCECAD